MKLRVQKTGKYIPGTRIPILPEKELLKSSTDKPSTVLNLAWHIVADVENNLAQYDYNPRLINILHLFLNLSVNIY